MGNFYELQDVTEIIRRGDTTIFYYKLNKPDGSEFDVTPYPVEFVVFDPITKEIITTLTKTHSDVTTGIFYNGDGFMPANVDLNNDNEIAVVLSPSDTESMVYSMYRFYVRFTSGADFFTPINGFIKVS